MMALVYCTTVAYGIVVGPRMTVLFAGEAAPLVTLMATALAMALLALYVKLAERFPNLSIFQWIVRLLGPLGYVLAVVLLLYLLSLVAFHGYNFALLLQLLFLNRTPLWVIVIFGYILAFSGAYLGLETMARFFQITMCLELVALPPLLLVGPSTFTWTHFQPWLPMDATTWFLGPLVALGSFVGFAHAPLALYPHIQTGGKILRPSLIGLSLAAVFIVGFTTSVLGVFGPDAVRFTLYPTFDYSQVAQVPLPLSFLARYSLFFSIIWVLAVTKLTMIDLFIVATGIRQILGLRSYQWPAGGGDGGRRGRHRPDS
ncbi:MAG: spore germination protein [Firmicutes bacterium]|nr:spore germination protein [Bacillota bacterium]